MAQTTILGLANTGIDKYVYAYSSDNPTFYDYIERTIPDNLDISLIQIPTIGAFVINTDSLSDLGCIVIAKEEVTLTDGLVKKFQYWKYGNLNEEHKICYDREISISKGLNIFFVAVYGYLYKAKTGLNTEKIDEVRKKMKRWLA